MQDNTMKIKKMNLLEISVVMMGMIGTFIDREIKIYKMMMQLLKHYQIIIIMRLSAH